MVRATCSLLVMGLAVGLLLGLLLELGASVGVAMADGSSSRAVGSPSDGRLVQGARFEESENLRRLPWYRGSDNRYATRELLDLLKRAADRVAERAPGARLSIGDLSAAEGGPIRWHRSHQNGRDADLSFFMLDAGGNVVEPRGFAHFGDDGVGRPPMSMLRFDDVRNWELVAALVDDPSGLVQQIFVARGLEERLLAVGRDRADQELVDRVARLVRQPNVRHPHRNHFHVRIACPPSDRPACRDFAR